MRPHSFSTAAPAHRARAHLRSAAIALAATILFLAPPRAHAGAIVDTTLWMPMNGAVTSVVTHGDRVYIGGNFTSVGVHSGHACLVRSDSGRPVGTFPRVNGGDVYAALADGSGGWYLGGDFSSVGTLTRWALAHVRADGTVDEWNPQVANAIAGVQGAVYSLVRYGDRILVGGGFGRVGGVVRNNFAVLDATTGALQPFNPNFDGRVDQLQLDGATLYAGGLFKNVSGQSRHYIAALDLAGSALLPFNPNANGPVHTILLDGNLLYAGGEFGQIGALLRTKLAAIDLTTGIATAWNPGADNTVLSLARHGSTIFAGGRFQNFGSRPRKYLAAWDLAADSVAAWNPSPNSGVGRLLAGASTLRVGGVFTSIASTTRAYVAELDFVTGAPTAWNPDPGGEVIAMANDGSRVFLGGVFTQLYAQPRVGLAAFDIATGELADWYPGALAAGVGTFYGINSMAARDGVIYFAGRFITVGGVSRRNVAAADATTGALTPFDPSMGSANAQSVSAIALTPSTLLAVGDFQYVNGTVPRYLAAEVRLDNGLVTPWYPYANRLISTISYSAGTIYIGGSFSEVGLDPVPRDHAAAFPLGSSIPTGWAPDPNGFVTEITRIGSTVYLGGSFSAVGGVPRQHVAAVDAGSGVPTSWNPGTTGDVDAIIHYGDGVLLGGPFAQAGGVSHHGIAYVHGDGSVDSSWNIGIHVGGSGLSGVYSIALGAGSSVYLGGAFANVNSLPGNAFGRLIPTTNTLDVPPDMPGGGVSRLAFAAGPNPTASVTRLSFTLPTRGEATLELFDVAGRCVATPLARQAFDAGQHSLEFDARDLAPGIYLARLRAGGARSVVRVVRVR